MKKFYTLLAAAVVALSASAASLSAVSTVGTPELKIESGAHSLKNGATAKNLSLSRQENQTKIKRNGAVQMHSLKKIANVDGTVFKAPAADGTYSIEGIYTMYINDLYFEESEGIASTTVTIEYDEDFECYFIVPDDSDEFFISDVPFDFNEETNTLTITPISLGQVSGSYVAFFPFVYNNGIKLQNSITATFDPKTSDINFSSDSGFSWPVSASSTFNQIAGWYNIFDVIGAYQEYVIDEVQEGQWKTIGNATFEDGWVLPSWQMDPAENAYKVELQQNVNNSNLYRLWEPYKNSPVADENISEFHGQIVFDITDPDHVIVHAGYPAGYKDAIDNADMFNFGTLGWQIYGFGSDYDADLYFDLIVNFMETNNQAFDTFKDGVLTISNPVFDLTKYCTSAYSWRTAYPAKITFPEGTITVGEVTYNAYPNMSVGFTVPVETEGLADDAVVTVYYKGPNDDDFVAVEENHGYNFVIEDLEADTDYTVTIYAASGDVKSEEVEVEFHTYKVETEATTAEVIHHVADNITDTSADINVSYGFKGIPEGAKASVLVKGENFKEYKVEIEEPVYGQTVTISVTDLTAGTTYQYQAVAQLETADGNIITRDAQYGEFTTLTEAEASIAVPEFNPADGSVVAPYEYIEITAEEGCDIYYMVEDYDDDFVKYDAEDKVMVPYTATESLTVKAYAEKDGVKSRVVSATYKVDKIDPQLEWIDADGEYVPELTVDMSDEAPEYPVLDGIIEGGVVYSSSDETVATIDAEGKITLVAAGTTFITATSNETATYKSAETSYKLIVTDAKSGIFTIGVDGESVRYFDINGIEVKSPAAGRPYIKVVGNKAVKVLVK